MNTHYTKDERRSPEEQKVYAEAQEWIMRLDDDRPDPDGAYGNVTERNAAFMEWVERSETHMRFFLQLLKVECRLYGLDATTIARIHKSINSKLNAHAIEVPRTIVPAQPAPTRKRSLPRGFWKILAPGAAMIALAFGLAAFYVITSPKTYSTQVGKHLRQSLSDGSIVELNTNSKVSVDYTGDSRRIRLIRGEAYFSVQHDPKRPFVVTSRDAQVTAIGTEFDVRLKDGSTIVAVYAGLIQASARHGTDEPTARTSELPKLARISQYARIGVGEIAEIGAGAVTPVVGRDIDDVVSWRHNVLDFHETPLEDVVLEFNRYNTSQILMDASVAHGRTLTANFDLHDPDDILAYARAQGLKVTRQGKNWVISVPD